MDHKNYVLEFLEKHKVVSGKNLSRNEFKDFIEYLKEQTTFLPDGVKPVFRIKCIVDGVTEIPVCNNEGCGNPTSIKPQQGHTRFFDTYIFTEYCSRKCAASAEKSLMKRAQTTLEKYGDENYMNTPEFKEKADKTKLERFGTLVPMRSDVVKEKIRKTFKERYGVEHAFQSPEFKEKAVKTNIERYGSTSHMHNKEIAEKTRASYLKNVQEKYGVNHTSRIGKKFVHIVSDDNLFIDFCSNYEYAEDIAAALEYHPSRIRARMAECSIQKSTKTSKSEKDLIDFVKSFYDGEIITNSRDVLNGRELDILLPELKVAIEFNGLYWHSEKHKHKYYHQDKSIGCMEAGVRLMHIWSDDWDSPCKRDILKKKIKAVCGFSEEIMYARKCKVIKLTSCEAKKFYDENHIQGSVNCKINYGLMYEGRIVACMGFKSVGDMKFDLSRYCSSVTVVGGFSKLLCAFKKDVEWVRIETFASLDYSHGEVYRKCGFTLLHVTPPNYRYYSNLRTYTISRHQAMKHKLHKILDNYDDNLSELANMKNNGWVRVFDSGSLKFVLDNNGKNLV